MVKKLNDATETGRIAGLIGAGAEIAGGAVGGTLGYFATGPVGAMLLGAGGAAAANILRQVGQEVSNRFLSPRELVRVGSVWGIAVAEIQRRLECGESLRSDGFFEGNLSERAPADEVIEHIMLKSQKDPEEKKLLHMGYLLSNIAFDNSVGPALANQVIKIFDGLTYRQLCILKIASKPASYHLRGGNYEDDDRRSVIDRNLQGVLLECLSLNRIGIVRLGSQVGPDYYHVVPAEIALIGLGVDVVSLLSIERIPDDDVKEIVDILS